MPKTEDFSTAAQFPDAGKGLPLTVSVRLASTALLALDERTEGAGTSGR